jgi:hypothetical protein
MSRVYAEAAFKPKRILQDYQPVISKKAWIVIIAAFILLLVYIIASGQSTSQGGSGFLSDLLGKLTPANDKGAASALENGLSFFKAIPPIAYLILISALALWTLDSILQRIRQNASEAQPR